MAMGEKPLSIAPFILPPPEPHLHPSACYITAVWPHSTNTLVQRWLSWQQCDDTHSPFLHYHWMLSERLCL